MGILEARRPPSRSSTVRRGCSPAFRVLAEELPPRAATCEHHRSQPDEWSAAAELAARASGSAIARTSREVPSLARCVARRSAARCSPLDGEPLGARRLMGGCSVLAT
ncbi:hypothetical protein Dimus_015051 [Dionaea muscipula]